MQNIRPFNYDRPEFTCRDCQAVISVPLTFEPEYRRRMVAIAAGPEGESHWDRQSKHLIVTDLADFYAPMDFATCRKYGSRERLNLAMIRREVGKDE